MTTAGYGWQKEHSVQDWLIKEPYRFEFYQAVRLIEAIYRRVAGELASDDATFLRFRSRIGFDFPASEIQAIDTRGGQRDVVAEDGRQFSVREPKAAPVFQSGTGCEGCGAVGELRDGGVNPLSFHAHILSPSS